MSGPRLCGECGAPVHRSRVAEASRIWAHVNVEDRRVSTCPGATLIPLSALVRIDGDPESDAPWATFVEVNRDAGLDVDSIADIEETLRFMGHHVGFHEADVGLVSHLDDLAIEAACYDAPIARVRDFVVDFWDRGDPSEALDEDVRAFALQVIRDGVADGSITSTAAVHLFDEGSSGASHEAPADVVDVCRVIDMLAAARFEELLRLANVARHEGAHGIADVAIERAVRS